MKKRFLLTLDQENMTAFQGLFKEMGLPPVSASLMIDDLIKEFMENVAPMLRSAKAGKPLKLSDFINVFANQIEKIEREEENATENRKEVASRKKNTGATRKQRATP